MLKVKFWGCRGSLPASYPAAQVREKLREVLTHAIAFGLKSTDDIPAFMDQLPFHLTGSYGTNTPCVEIIGGDEVVICDAGSGLRDLGKQLVATKLTAPLTINILMSHLHWDHVQGFPFFIPAYMQGTRIRFWGGHENIQDTFIRQQSEPNFPVQFQDMGAEMSFHHLDPQHSYDIGGFTVTCIEQPHPGGSYGFRFQLGEKSVVYSTDAEHTEDMEQDDYRFLEFFKNTDVLIFDGQFSLADHLYTKQYWGHSSNLAAIELAIRAGVKKLALFHSDHTYDDYQLQKFLKDSQRYLEIYAPGSALELLIAYDHLQLVV